MNSYIRIEVLYGVMLVVIVYFSAAGYCYGKMEENEDKVPVKILCFILALIWLPLLIVTYFIPDTKQPSYDDPDRERNKDHFLRQRRGETASGEDS